MALSATFTANFSSFYDAVDKADAKLKDFGDGADKVGRRLDTLADQFSGRKIVQEATIMAKAVEDIGGVTKLTEQELKRLGATTNEAVQKMKLLGMDVPKNLQAIADQTKNANKQSIDWMGTLGKVAATIGAAFSIGAIVNFIGSVFDAAGAIKDMADQWGVSTDAVQKWTAAARASGVEAQTVGKSVQFLTEHLSEGSKEYEALLKNLNLSGAALRNMKMEDAFTEVLKAIASVEDETLQLDLAIGLLGPSAKKWIGAIRDGFLETADATDTMSKETIRRLDDAGDAWGKLKDLVVIYTGEMLAGAIDTTTRMTKSWGSFFQYMGAGLKSQFSWSGDYVGTLVKLEKSQDLYNESLKKGTAATQGATAAGGPLNASLKTTAQVQEDVRQKTEALKKAQEARTKTQADAKKAQDEYNKSIEDHRRDIEKLMEQFEGTDITKKMFEYLEALEHGIPIHQMTAEVQKNIHKVMTDAIAVYKAAGKEGPQAMYDIAIATDKLNIDTIGYLKNLRAMADAWKTLPIGGGIDITKIGTPVELTKPPNIKWIDELESSIYGLSRSFVELGAASDGAFGEMMVDIGAVIDAMAHADASTKQFQGGLALFQGGSIGKGLSGMAQGAMGVVSSFQSATKETGKLQSTLNGAAIGFSVGGPWGAAVGAAAGLIKGFFNSMKEKKEVKRLRDEMIDAAGGMTAFKEAAEEANVSLDKFFAAKKKTDLEAAVKDITAAFEYQAEALDIVIETAERYGFTLEELGPALASQELDKQAQQLYKDWEVLNSAGLDTIAITERMGESVSAYVQQAMAMGLEVPMAMRPMLESFAKAGTLVDANGEAITDLEAAGLSFTLSMSDGFKALIDEVKLLTDAIGRSLGIAIRNIPQPRVTGQVSWEVDPVPTATARSAPSVEPQESYQHGTGGFRNFGAGTPVMLHGWEAVVPRSDSGAFATVQGAGAMAAPAAAMPPIIINAQGALFDTPGDLQRLADRVAEALSAKHGLTNKRRAA